MKWFKHYSNAKFDPKIRRLISKFGIEGYGIYWAVVESIAFQLETNKPIPDLEENAADMAEMFRMDSRRVEEILKYCISEDSGLFEYNQDSGRIMCLKLLFHLDNTMSGNPEIKKIISNFNKLEETSSSLKQIRLDKIRLNKDKADKKPFVPPTLQEITAYIEKNSLNVDACYFLEYFTAGDWTDSRGNKVKNWKQKLLTWHKHAAPKVSQEDEMTKMYGEPVYAKRQ